MKNLNSPSYISLKCVSITPAGYLIQPAEAGRHSAQLRDLGLELVWDWNETPNSPQSLSEPSQTLVGIGSDNKKIYLALWNGQMKMMKELSPYEAINYASSLLKEGVILLGKETASLVDRKND